MALVATSSLAGAASSKASAAKISAHLTKTSFTSSQAGSVKLIYSFSATSKSFSYQLTFKKGSKWQQVKSIKKKGSFKGSKSMTVRQVFAGKPVKVGSYKLKLSADGGSKLLSFKVVKTAKPATKPSGGGGTTPTGSAPTNSSLPTISGTTTQGQTLSASNGSWANSPTSYARQWRRCDSSGASCSDISGATSGTYLLALADVAKTIRVVATASNSYGSASATSGQAAVISGLPPTGSAPSNTALPTISGTTTQGQTLSASNGSWSNSPISYAYQWRRCDSSGVSCSDISSATSSAYVLQTADVSHTLRVVVTASNSYGSGSATSGQTAAVAGLPPAGSAPTNTSLPTISGTTTQGQTLTASNGSWSSSPTSYTYQWRRCDGSGENCSDISGAKSSSYQLVLVDVGATVRVVVSATNAYGFASATSSQTSLVRRIKYVSGTLSSDTVWGPQQADVYVVEGQLTIPAGVTLTLEAGAIVKYEDSNSANIYVMGEGSLVVNGTASNPVVFTSISDDSAGGDTNDDGSASVGSSWNSARAISAYGHVSIEHARFGYLASAIYEGTASSSSASVTVNDSTIESPIKVDSSINEDLHLTRNTFAIRTTPDGSIPDALYLKDVDPSGVILAGADTNTFTGPAAARRIALCNITVLAFSSWTVSGDGGGVLVPTGCSYHGESISGTLTLEAGAIVKYRETSLITGNTFTVRPEASLVVNGTASDPVVFTSITDDSAGGDTNGDGSASVGSSWNSTTAISEYGSVSIEHARFGYLGEVIYNGVSGPLTINDSTIESPISVYSLATLHLKRNTFAIRAQPGGSIPDALYLEDLDPSGVALAGPDTNTFTGPAAARRIALCNITLPAAASWTVSGDGGGVLVPDAANGSGGEMISGTLTLEAGAIVKYRNPNWSSGRNSFTVDSGGSLVVNGTASDPVVFTSDYDDSVGGDTNGDGFYDLGGIVRWAIPSAIIVDSGGTATLNGISIRYAFEALQVMEGGVATIHGSILYSAIGVATENGTWVDATHVDWGDPSGPAPIGTGAEISDGVFVIPWVGYVEPQPPPPPPPGPDPVDTSCKRVLFIGVRGSGDSQDQFFGNDVRTAGMGEKVADVFLGFVDVYGVSNDVRALGLEYPAASTLNLAWNPEGYMDSAFDGVTELEYRLQAEEDRCRSEKIVLAGYSQGALVVHLALGWLGEAGSPLVSPTKLAGVVLVADPAKQGDSAEIRYGDAAFGANGVYSKAGFDDPYVPGNLVTKTITMCHNHDIVCAPGFWSTISNHTNYSDVELEPLGGQVAVWLLDG